MIATIYYDPYLFEALANGPSALVASKNALAGLREMLRDRDQALFIYQLGHVSIIMNNDVTMSNQNIHLSFLYSDARCIHVIRCIL